MKKQQEPSPSVGLAATAAPQVSSSQSATQVTLEGLLKKRGARMHRWSTRYIILQGSKLSYKIKKDSPTLRGSFDLVPGCILTEVRVSYLMNSICLSASPTNRSKMRAK